MDSVSYSGHEMAFKQTHFSGDGSTVLYIHGSGGDHRDWKYQYNPRGRDNQLSSAVAIDLSGHGKSDEIDTKPGNETLSAYADDVVAVARETNANVLVGNSLGGAIVLHVLLERNVDLDAAILAGSGAKLAVRKDVLKWVDDGFEQAIDFFFSEDQLFHDPNTEIAELTKQIMRESGSAVLGRDLRTCNQFDVRDEIDSIRTPLLAVTGEFDNLTPPWYHEYLERNIQNANHTTIQDAAHFSMAEQPNEFNEVVADFLSSI